MIVVFGSAGQVGRALQNAIGEAPEHVFLSRDSRHYCGDITNTAGLIETLLELKPEIVINAAAYTNVDQAESDPDLTQRINADAPAVMAQTAAKLGSLLVHYSTDYVFDGSGTHPRKETDACRPLSVYGSTKYAAEQAITAAGGKYLILRSSWIYSTDGKNFLKTMLELAETRETLHVVSDQFGVPTHADYLAEITLDLINLATPGFGSSSNTIPAWGIYHCAPSGETNLFDYARLVINTAKSLGRAQTCKSILPIATADYPTPAKRPLNSRLNTTKLQTVLNRHAPDWKEGVITSVAEVLQQSNPFDHHSSYDLNT